MACNRWAELMWCDVVLGDLLPRCVVCQPDLDTLPPGHLFDIIFSIPANQYSWLLSFTV